MESTSAVYSCLHLLFRETQLEILFIKYYYSAAFEKNLALRSHAVIQPLIKERMLKKT